MLLQMRMHGGRWVQRHHNSESRIASSASRPEANSVPLAAPHRYRTPRLAALAPHAGASAEDVATLAPPETSSAGPLLIAQSSTEHARAQRGRPPGGGGERTSKAESTDLGSRASRGCASGASERQ